MENNIRYIPMEAAMQQELKSRYTKPFKRNSTILIGTLMIIYLLIMSSLLFFADPKAPVQTGPMMVVTIGFGLVFWMAYPKFKKANIHYLDDANFGQIAVEETTVSKVFDTPSGINIYWLNSATIKSFTPEPYRIFREGDIVTIYYLKHSAEYLGYELS